LVCFCIQKKKWLLLQHSYLWLDLSQFEAKRTSAYGIASIKAVVNKFMKSSPILFVLPLLPVIIDRLSGEKESGVCMTVAGK
jgi:hypothetical protein